MRKQQHFNIPEFPQSGFCGTSLECYQLLLKTNFCDQINLENNELTEITYVLSSPHL
jgi:hypothetical protein